MHLLPFIYEQETSFSRTTSDGHDFLMFTTRATSDGQYKSIIGKQTTG